MTYFIAYDISDSEQRSTVAKILENVGPRIQNSFFQCELDVQEMEALFLKLTEYIDPACDRLHIYPICKDCLRLKKTLGKNKIYEEQHYLVL